MIVTRRSATSSTDLSWVRPPRRRSKLSASIFIPVLACQEYLKASNQAIAGLGGFSFEVNPDLHGRVLAALTLRAQQLETKRIQQRPMWWSYLAAFVLTVAGSFTAARFSGIAGAVFHIEPGPLHIGLLALWIVPSLCFCLLFPVLHRLSVGWTNEKGLSQ